MKHLAVIMFTVAMVWIAIALHDQKSHQNNRAPESASPVPTAALTTNENVKRPITVAMLDFDMRLTTADVSSEMIADVVAANLTDKSTAVLVERKDLQRILTEQGLKLHGMADEERAAAVGKLIGARIMIMGKGFKLGNQTVLTAKLIGTETGLVETVMIQGNDSAKVDELIHSFSDAIAARFSENAMNMLPADEPSAVDPIPSLKSRLDKLSLPTVMVCISEEHLHQQPVRSVDPAVETEVKLLLASCGVVIRDFPSNELAENVHRDLPDLITAAPEGVELVIVGKGFSEATGTTGELHSCSARAEINVVRLGDRNIVLAESVTTHGADLGEQTAGKRALQSAGHELGLRLLRYLADSYPEKPALQPVVPP